MYQEGAEHVETDEVDDGKATATRLLPTGVVVGVRVTQLPWQARQHDVLPRFSRGTPVRGGKVTSQLFTWDLAEHVETGRVPSGGHNNCELLPEEQQHGLGKSLEVVVPIDLRAVDHGDFSKHLQQHLKNLTHFISVKQTKALLDGMEMC